MVDRKKVGPSPFWPSANIKPYVERFTAELDAAPMSARKKAFRQPFFSTLFNYAKAHLQLTDTACQRVPVCQCTRQIQPSQQCDANVKGTLSEGSDTSLKMCVHFTVRNLGSTESAKTQSQYEVFWQAMKAVMPRLFRKWSISLIYTLFVLQPMMMIGLQGGITTKLNFWKYLVRTLLTLRIKFSPTDHQPLVFDLAATAGSYLLLNNPTHTVRTSDVT